MNPHGRARVNPRNPQAFAVCDRCQFLYNHRDLRFQFEWRGTSLQNIRFLVCDTCLDKPQEQLRVIRLPPDPMPIQNPRPELADTSGVTPPPPPPPTPPPTTTGEFADDFTNTTEFD